MSYANWKTGDTGSSAGSGMCEPTNHNRILNTVPFIRVFIKIMNLKLRITFIFQVKKSQEMN